ncbi:MAG: MBOAT family protein [Lachnospiraceae bacterium]|nr:MBOAT family protein [Lachnospiraceae bacterium]
MLFSSMIFLWVFLPVVLIVSRILPIKLNNIFLLIASLLFYAFGEPKYVLLMLCSIALNYTAGRLLARFDGKVGARRAVLVVAVTLNLGLLLYFKYMGLIVQTLNHLAGDRLTVPEIALPIGISFFTFQALSYVVDVYRGDCDAQKDPLHLALYISFFPQLIAGPIVKYRDVSEQIVNRTNTGEKTAEGIRRFIYGLAKKVLIANALSEGADLIYDLPVSELTGALVWMASVLYTFQIYYDFSGYSDMAIGLGKMFGFDFKENFRYPYTSLSIREFWQRWHISLGTWFKEYLYIPLGGNRKGRTRTYINLVIVFFLTGFWHGAGYNFILWGLYHGFFSVLERTRLGDFLKRHRVPAFVYTCFVVNFGWVIFRIVSLRQLFEVSRRFFLPFAYSTSHYAVAEFVTPHMLAALAAAILGMGFLNPLLKRMERTAIPEALWCGVLMALCVISLASNTYNPFIYFRF